MPQDFTLGRAGLATASGGDGLTLRATSFEQRGDQATVEGIIRGSEMTSATALADVKALRDQLQGYDLNTDEPVVPVTSAQDSSRDGFYRVQRVEVSSEVTGRLRSGSDGNELAYTWTAELLRVPGWQAPIFETAATGNVRENDHSIAIGSTFPAIGLNSGATAVIEDSGYTANATPTGAEGQILICYDSAPTDYTGAPTWATTAADFYKGCCRVEVTRDAGSTWRTVTARQAPNLPTAWRISNSLVRVTATTTASKTELSVEHHDGSQWETAKVYQITSDTSYTATTSSPRALTILRNGPECVAVRVTTSASTTGGSYQYLDVTLRRGMPYMEGVYYPLALSDWGLRRGTNEAGAALSTTCGLRANADDAGGNKYVIASAMAVSTDTTIGAIRVSDTYFPFCIGSAIGGTVGTAWGNTMGVAKAYMAAVEHSHQIVVR